MASLPYESNTDLRLFSFSSKSLFHCLDLSFFCFVLLHVNLTEHLAPAFLKKVVLELMWIPELERKTKKKRDRGKRTKNHKTMNDFSQ